MMGFSGFLTVLEDFSLSNWISEEKISEVRNTANIVDVISEVVQLRKAGINLIGLCPFHSEKTPSFTVHPDKQIFHCFGCGEGGNVITFVMKHDRLSFPDALTYLAGKYGIEIPKPDFSGKDQERYSERDKLIRINRQAADFYHQVLLDGQSGKAAAEYLANRNISSSTIEQFHLGYAPDGWKPLYGFLQSKKIPPQFPVAAGLIIPNKRNDGYYDRFRKRIIFPIYSVTGQIIGFGGRAIDDALPKYLNSPETMLFNKRQTLFGLDKAKIACRGSDTIFVVEGYMDCIMLVQEGLKNTAATLGTAMTPEHVRILRGFAGKIILVYDSDEAGIKAAGRSVNLFMEHGFDARIMVLPEGHDPDSFVRQKGIEAFKALSSKAFGLIEFMIHVAIKKHGSGLEGKIEALNDLLGSLSEMDPVARSLSVRSVSERLGIDEAAILHKLKNFEQDRKIHGGNRFQRQTEPGNGDFMKEAEQGVGNPAGRMERQIIAIMLQFPEVVPDINKNNLLSFFKDSLLKSIGMIIVEGVESSRHSISNILDRLEDPEKRRIAAELSMKDEVRDDAGCKKLVHQFMVYIQSQREKSLNKEIKMAEKNNDMELLLKLLAEKQKNAISTEHQKMTMTRR